MRFISKYGRFGVLIDRGHYEAYASGAVREVKPEISAYFRPEGLTPDEREMALETWAWNGSYQEMDEVTIVPPDYRIGVYDSLLHQAQAGFDDEVREMIEEKLQQNAQDYDNIIVVRSRIAPPWPRYDEFRGSPQALVRRLVEDGHDLELVLAYERAHQDRPKVVDEIEKAIETGTVEVVLEEEVVG